MEAIVTTIYKIIWGILGGAISLAFVVGVVGALAYMAYYLIKYGWRAFKNEFITRP